MNIKNILPLLFLIVTFASCKRDKNDNINTVPKKLYILTNEQDTVTGKNTTRYHFDGVVTTIESGSNASIFGYDMDVDGTDVYVLARKQVTSGGVSTYTYPVYKNGSEIQSLPYSSAFNPNCIKVVGADMYIAGAGANSGSSNYKVKVWKNGTLTDITNGTTTTCNVYDLVVNGSDVYVAGYEYTPVTNIKNAKYWKNGTGVALTNNTVTNNDEVHRIVVNGSDVYCSGMVNKKATVWKNGAATTLNTTNEAYCYGLAVNGNNVYAAGSVTNAGYSRAAYWKNTMQFNLDLLNSALDKNSNVFGVRVDGNDVYVIGDVQLTASKFKPVYWKNSVETVLPTSASATASAYRIVLK